MVVAEGAQGRGHDLGRRGLGDPDPDAHALPAGRLLTAMAGRRAVNLTVACGGMLVLAAALTPAVVGAAPLPLVVMLCVTTAARAALWTVSYPLAAAAGRPSTEASSRPGQGGAGLGASIGLLNLIWAATAVLGP